MLNEYNQRAEDEGRSVMWDYFQKAFGGVKYALYKSIESLDVRSPEWQIFGETRRHKRWDEDSPIVSDILMELRLLKQGSVKVCTAFLVDSENSFCYDVSNPSPNITYTAYDLYSGDYFLEQTEADGLRKIHEMIQAITIESIDERFYSDKREIVEIPHILGFSLRKFMEIYEVDSIEDVAVPMWSAFENLCCDPKFRWRRTYLPTNSSTDEKVGNAIGSLLGGDNLERNRIWDDMRKLYKIRCGKGVAHGKDGFVDFADKRTIDTLKISEEYLRRTLCKLLDRYRRR
jgi:hypothetical protein